ncbi:MAG TPA: class I SAM-dependent methyltransferase family protein [Candidatus Thermoplasmatota archaeon]|nr:class I SAM-dependent methyltransferase family protein [Candidatus Thermoplasmatota archaeon]
MTIPVVEGPALAGIAASIGASVVEDPPLEPREERPTPYAQVLARLPPEARPHAPERWEKLGDVVVLRLADEAMPHARAIAAAYADVLRARCVLRDASGVAGELREMRAQLLLGDDPVTTHLENGVRYRFDASRVMFSSGNVAERTRVIHAPGESVADMFAGIGYFSIPLALRGGPARVVAMEKNPVSFGYLRENVALNGVERVVEPWLGDNRDYPHEGAFDRVLMGYFPGTARFLPKALALLKPTGGVIHYHDTAHERRWKEEMTRSFLDAARACGRVVAVQEARVVKSQSPGVVHAVLVARVAS